MACKGIDLETVIALSKIYPIKNIYDVKIDSRIIEERVRKSYPGKSESFYMIELKLRVLTKCKAGYYNKDKTSW